MKVRIFRQDLNSLSDFFILKDDSDYHYLINVLKIKINDKVNFFSDQIEGSFLVKEISKKYILFQFEKETIITENYSSIDNLAFILPIIKADKLNIIAKQVAEIGFGHIFLAKTNFSQEIEKNYKEFKFFANLKEGMEQSEGFYFPRIHEVRKLDKIIESLKNYTILYGDFSQDAVDSKDLFFVSTDEKILKLKKDIKNKQKIAVLIGPEGGLSNLEVNFLESKNCFAINLGNRKQRCETASICLMTLAKNLLESSL